MALSNDLVSQFAKIVNNDKKEKTETTVYGTIVEYEGSKYVKLDGSDLLTPISSTTTAKDSERVTVMIKNHSAVVTGNLSSPSARSGDVDDLSEKVTELDNVYANFVTTEELDVEKARIDELKADNATIKETLSANEADISELKADNATIIGSLNAHEASIESLSADKLNATDADLKYATIENLNATNENVHNLNADYADFKQTSTDELTAIKASIESVSVESLKASFASIDFSNIGTAAIEQFFSKSGLIENVVVGEGNVTGRLVGVTIIGDIIEGGTIKADKFVIKGEDGLYYKLNTDGITTEAEQTEYNSLNGSVIAAKSITASKISVDDLVAFGATIGGFHLTDSSIYSGAKASADNTTLGIFLGKDGQINIGDETRYLKFVKDEDGNYVLDISADNILFGSSKKSLEEAFTEVDDSLTETINEQYTLITKDCETIILSALDSYVETGDYETFKSTLNTQLSLMADQIVMNFTSTSDSVNTVNDDMQGKFETLNKYIRYSADGITIGVDENQLKLTLDNDKIKFTKNGETVGWWDGTDFHTGNIVVEVNERAQFGNFAFIPRSDGSLMFLKVAETT